MRQLGEIIRRVILSTPSLGITRQSSLLRRKSGFIGFQLPLSGSLEILDSHGDIIPIAFNSLSRDH
jgi:hypothetical protein